MIPVECVARGYLTGSALADYARSGAVCGIRLPAGLADGSRLPRPVFTPATKAPRLEPKLIDHFVIPTRKAASKARREAIRT